MSRTNIKKLLYLNDSELTEKEKIKLNNHLRKHPDRLNERAKLNEYNKNVNQLITEVPVLKDGNQLTNEIMRAVNKTIYRKENPGFTTNLINILTLPAVRCSLISFLLIIVGAFTAEEITTSEDISRLEAAMDIKSSVIINTQATVLNRNYLLKSLNDVLELVEGNKKSVELPAGWMMLKKHEIFKFMVTYDELQKILNNYSNIDLSGYPLLNKIKLHNSLNEREFEMLLSNSKELEKELKELKNREKLK